MWYTCLCFQVIDKVQEETKSRSGMFSYFHFIGLILLPDNCRKKWEDSSLNMSVLKYSRVGKSCKCSLFHLDHCKIL